MPSTHTSIRMKQCLFELRTHPSKSADASVPEIVHLAYERDGRLITTFYCPPLWVPLDWGRVAPVRVGVCRVDIHTHHLLGSSCILSHPSCPWHWMHPEATVAPTSHGTKQEGRQGTSPGRRHRPEIHETPWKGAEDILPCPSDA